MKVNVFLGYLTAVSGHVHGLSGDFHGYATRLRSFPFSPWIVQSLCCAVRLQSLKVCIFEELVHNTQWFADLEQRIRQHDLIPSKLHVNSELHGL